MAGNVREWCLDAYDSYFYRNSPRRNPIASTATIIKGIHVLRGGSWGVGAHFVRVANRFGRGPTAADLIVGFRCARTVTP